MRLWSIHPMYLDAKGLVALWREALLAQKILRGLTKGYRRHPQLERFRDHPEPVAAIATYLRHVSLEGKRRGYQFQEAKIAKGMTELPIAVTAGQLLFELDWLRTKLQQRDPAVGARLEKITLPLPHPLFAVVTGDKEPWEKGRPPDK